MVRNLEVYPKAFLDGSIWKYTLAVGDSDFDHVIPAGVTVETPVQFLKVVFGLTVEDSDPDLFVDIALFNDDIHPAPGQTETVWGNWQAIAEGIITGLSPGEDFWGAWTQGDTQAIRQDIQRALVSGPGGIGRGWTITFFHQHEGSSPWVTEG